MMPLSLSCRIAESFLNKEVANLSLEQLADLAVEAGFEAICMRASQIGIQSPPAAVQNAKRILDQRELAVTMVTGDFDIVSNNDSGPNCLQHITPYLDLAEQLGARLLRVCIKKSSDISAAQRAADEAAERGMHLLHQCHIQSLFETLPEIKACLQAIDRANFGLIFEAANLEQCGQSYGPTTISELKPWIRNVYLQNQRLSPAGSLTLNTWCRGSIQFDLCEIPDCGGIDFASIFEGLSAVDYTGPITVHQSAPLGDNITALDAATQTARFIKTQLASAG
ncbi:MAG: sugar phosphate isomerase/epimerase [Planctomycetales bacterium]|nr:sugar phosphate isomerase/epimerase [Planctomycetales bacterium]